MANLSFFYSSMNSGKTLDLIKTFYNFVKIDSEGNPITDNVICLTSAADNRFGQGVIASRPLQTKLEAIPVSENDELYPILINEVIPNRKNPTELILVDEAQFFTAKQIRDLARIVDNLNINVICYGLRTTFKGTLFSGSAELLGIADKIREIKNRCPCGSKATMNLLFDSNKTPISDGNDINIGDESQYISLCRKHFFDSLKNQKLSVS
tara:strand:- start:803 stop:1432 length:630 start_codon:yes stop_codon:yes gene_type:complete